MFVNCYVKNWIILINRYKLHLKAQNILLFLDDFMYLSGIAYKNILLPSNVLTLNLIPLWWLSLSGIKDIFGVTTGW